MTEAKDFDDCARSDRPASDLSGVTIEEVLQALALPGMGAIRLRRLLQQFGSLQSARNRSEKELAGLGLPRETVQALLRRGESYDPTDELTKAQHLGVEIIPFTSPRFPRALQPFDDAPAALYVKGDILERDAIAVAIVGARRASLYGKMHAERLAFDLAQAGFTVISGLAQGIDAAAHEGALKGQGRTLAVLGNGLSAIYPPEHTALAERIAQNGALISELPMDTAPAAGHFPHRNRIIAGLSLGVVVVEAGRKSGALITARLAGEMGREVFAVPGDIGRPQTRGPHHLLRDGAKLVESVEDIIEELGPLAEPVQMRNGEISVPHPRALVLNDHERAVFDLLDAQPKSIDEITRESGLSPANTASILMVLELKHLAVQMPGKLYARAGTLQ